MSSLIAPSSLCLKTKIDKSLIHALIGPVRVWARGRPWACLCALARRHTHTRLTSMPHHVVSRSPARVPVGVACTLCTPVACACGARRVYTVSLCLETPARSRSGPAAVSPLVRHSVRDSAERRSVLTVRRSHAAVSETDLQLTKLPYQSAGVTKESLSRHFIYYFHIP